MKYIIDQDELFALIEEEMYRGIQVKQDGGLAHTLMYKADSPEDAAHLCSWALKQFAEALESKILKLVEEQEEGE